MRSWRRVAVGVVPLFAALLIDRADGILRGCPAMSISPKAGGRLSPGFAAAPVGRRRKRFWLTSAQVRGAARRRRPASTRAFGALANPAPHATRLPQDAESDELDNDLANHIDGIQSRIDELEGILGRAEGGAVVASQAAGGAAEEPARGPTRGLAWSRRAMSSFAIADAEKQALSFAVTGGVAGAAMAKAFAFASGGISCVFGAAVMVLATKPKSPSTPVGKAVRRVGVVPLLLWNSMYKRWDAIWAELRQRYRAWKAYERYFKQFEDLDKEWEVSKQVQSFSSWWAELGQLAEKQIGDAVRLVKEADRGARQTLESMPKDITEQIDGSIKETIETIQGGVKEGKLLIEGKAGKPERGDRSQARAQRQR